MANMYAWHSPEQCDMLLDAMRAMSPLSDVAPSIVTVDESHKHENVHSNALEYTYMHATSSISGSESDNYENAQYTHAQLQAYAHMQAISSINGDELLKDENEHVHVSNWHSEHSYTNTTVSAEDLDFLDYPPMVSQDMSFLSASSPDMEIACDEWSLPQGESLSFWRAQADNLFMNQASNADYHECYETQCDQNHDQHDTIHMNQPVSESACADNQVKQSSNDGHGIEDLITKSSCKTTHPASGEGQRNLVNTSLEVPMKKPKRRVFKRHKSENDLKQAELSDFSDAMEDDEIDKLGSDGKPRVSSKNLVSERKRRMKLNDRLYTLRAIIPKISKMDKASIVADAISHVQDLQKQLKSMQEEILTLQAGEDATPEALSSCAIDSMEAQDDLPQHKVVEVNVTNMEPSMYHLRIHSKKGPGIFVQLTKALEALNFGIVSSNFTTINDHIINTIVITVESDEMWRPEDLKQMMVQIFPSFGLIL